jgi:hypothetical protein
MEGQGSAGGKFLIFMDRKNAAANWNQATARAGAMPDPAAQLVQLRQTEAFGMLHHHHRSPRRPTPTFTNTVATSSRTRGRRRTPPMRLANPNVMG